MSVIRNPQSAIRDRVARDAEQRDWYARAALAEIPRLLGSIDRNRFRLTYGSFDRQYWHYRTAAFPSEMYQEAVLPLALVYTLPLPDNRWHRAPRLRELTVAALRFSARSTHGDGSCDDYYPYERALGAAVFSLNSATEAYRLLELDDAEIRELFLRRARWIVSHGESGTLANHHALAALALERVARITGLDDLHQASRRKMQQVLGWQSDEGWFEEYGGADPGYQVVTIDCLAKLRALTGDEQLDEPLRRAVQFARRFLHPDGSYGGEYGSRGTYHFYPHGCELLAGDFAEAADLADGFLRAMCDGQTAYFVDDRMIAHRLGNLIEAYRDWSPERPAAEAEGNKTEPEYLSHAQLLVDRTVDRHTVVSAARGGVVKHFVAGELIVTDTGLIVETTDGRLAVSQQHDQNRNCRLGSWPVPGIEKESKPETHSAVEETRAEITVEGSLHWVRFETATPVKQAVLHLGMMTVGRWCRTLVRKLLQRRLITGRKVCSIRLVRTVELLDGSPSLRVIDHIVLTDPHVQVRRMSFTSDLESVYVAASGVYQNSVLQSWTPLDEQVEILNRRREVTVVRTW